MSSSPAPRSAGAGFVRAVRPAATAALEVAQVLVADGGRPRRVDLRVALDDVVVVVLVLQLAEDALEVDVALAQVREGPGRVAVLDVEQRPARLVVRREEVERVDARGHRPVQVELEEDGVGIGLVQEDVVEPYPARAPELEVVVVVVEAHPAVGDALAVAVHLACQRPIALDGRRLGGIEDPRDADVRHAQRLGLVEDRVEVVAPAVDRDVRTDRPDVVGLQEAAPGRRRLPLQGEQLHLGIADVPEQVERVRHAGRLHVAQRVELDADVLPRHQVLGRAPADLLVLRARHPRDQRRAGDRRGPCSQAERLAAVDSLMIHGPLRVL